MKIILKDKRVLEYNYADNVSVVDRVIKVMDKNDRWIAVINLDCIERIDVNPPCSIRYPKKKKK